MPAITALVGTRIYPVEVPEGDEYFPAITYAVLSCPRINSLTGPSGLAHPRVQLHCWARNPGGYLAADALREAVRTAMNGFRGTWGALEIDHCTLLDEGDLFEPAAGIEAQKTYGARMDFEIWHKE